MADIKTYLTQRKHFENRLGALKEIRQTYEGDWKDLRDYLAPAAGSFNDPISDTNKKPDHLYRQNINTFPQRYLRNLAAAIVNTMCPPSALWFGLKVPEETREEQIWLKSAARQMHRQFNLSGLNENLNSALWEAATFGINPMGMQYDSTLGIDFVQETIGEFFVAEGPGGVINTMYRRFAMTNIQLYEKFGEEALPETIREQLANDQTEGLNNVVHAIEPNPRFLPSWNSAGNKAFISAYYLEDDSEAGFLEIKPLSYFPFPTIRWYKSTKNAYSTGVGADILGDVKSLQKYEEDLAKASAKLILPPVKAKPDMKNAKKDASAGGVTYTDDPQGFTALYSINYDINAALQNIMRIQERLYSLTYNDLFYAILSRQKTMSATEVASVDQEKMAMLGSVVGRLQTEGLRQIVETGFHIMLDNGMFQEEMPSTLRGKELEITYHSLLAQSQDLSDLTLLERWLQFCGTVATMNPDAARKPNILAICDYYAGTLDVDLSLVVPNEQIEQAKAAEAEQQQIMIQQQQSLEALAVQSKAAKDYAGAATTAGQVRGDIGV